jgi:hypothetical protein
MRRYSATLEALEETISKPETGVVRDRKGSYRLCSGSKAVHCELCSVIIFGSPEKNSSVFAVYKGDESIKHYIDDVLALPSSEKISVLQQNFYCYLQSRNKWGLKVTPTNQNHFDS